MKIGSAVVSTSRESKEMEYKNIVSDDVSRLTEVQKNRFLLGQAGLVKLQSYTSFEEIRIFCSKPWHGTTLDISTTKNTLGRQAVEFLLGRTTNKPSACGSYKRLPADHSILGQHCQNVWGATWNSANLYYFPIFINGKAHVNLQSSDRMECDDYKDDPGFSPVGSWAYYVR